MIKMVKSPDSEYYSPCTRVILFTPPPINTYQRLADLQSRDPPLALDRLFATTKEYADAVREIGKQHDVGQVDVWNLFWDAAGHQEESLVAYLIDGLHLNAAGYEVSCSSSITLHHSAACCNSSRRADFSNQIVYDHLIETIKQKYPEVHYENLRPTFPLCAFTFLFIFSGG